MAKSGVTAPLGYKSAGVACGLKKNGQRDLAWVVSDRPANAAGIFTKNIVKGHSLQWSRQNIRRGVARAVVINSGCANACVGPQGDSDAAETAGYAAYVLIWKKSGAESGRLLTLSRHMAANRLPEPL